jgi:hypothetical protein
VKDGPVRQREQEGFREQGQSSLANEASVNERIVIGEQDATSTFA